KGDPMSFLSKGRPARRTLQALVATAATFLLVASNSAFASHAGVSRVAGEEGQDGHVSPKMLNGVVPFATGNLKYYGGKVISNGNTLYMINFPAGKSISQGGSNSCVAGGFCAYHGTVAAASPISEFYYGVLPDMSASSGCASGCGNSTTFNNQTSVASHEMIEA